MILSMNSVFHPPGSNPFDLPPLPQSHYIPSPAKEGLDKSITLTPQKLNRRHEYSLPPEVYTPEHYSICEDTTSTKPPLPSPPGGAKDIAVDLQKYLDDVESWTSSRFCERWSSKDFESLQKDDIPSLNVTNTTDMSGSRIPLTSTQRSKTVPVKLKTSFASDRNVSKANSQRPSNVAMRLNRFRYGEPKPPQERKRERIKIPTPSSPRGQRFTAFSAPTGQKPVTSVSRKILTEKQQKDIPDSYISERSKMKDTSCPPSRISMQSFQKLEETTQRSLNAPDSPTLAETSISRLNSKLEKLLQESTSVISSPEPPSTQRSRVTPSDVSASYDSKVSSLGSDSFTGGLPFNKIVEIPRQPRKPLDITREKFASYDVMAKKRLQDENRPPVARSPQKVRPEDDILQQWRLRRKLETARDEVERGRGVPQRTWKSPYKPCYTSKAEKPFITQHPYQLQEEQYPSVCGDHRKISFPPLVTHKPTCNCQVKVTDRPQTSPPKDGDSDVTPPDTMAPVSGCRISYSPTRKMKTVGVSAIPMKSMETQTTRSLLLSDEDAVSFEDTRKVSEPKPNGSLPHTSTPASSVSFHKVKIIQADVEGSPVTSKGSPLQRDLSPVSTKTDTTTTWSSTEHRVVKAKKGEEWSKSPLSSVKASELHTEGDSELGSPTTNVVRQIVGSRLFNSSQTPLSTSRIARLQQKKKMRFQEAEESEISDQLSSSYTSTLQNTLIPEPTKASEASSSVTDESEKTEGTKEAVTEPKTVSPPPEGASPDEEGPSPPTSRSSTPTVQGAADEKLVDFDPSEMFDKLLEDIANDPGDFPNDPVLQTLRSQRDQFLAQFREIEKEIEECEEADEES